MPPLRGLDFCWAVILQRCRAYGAGNPHQSPLAENLCAMLRKEGWFGHRCVTAVCGRCPVCRFERSRKTRAPIRVPGQVVLSVMARTYRIELNDLDLGQLLDDLETRAESWERAAEYLRTETMPDGEFLGVEECSKPKEAEEIAEHYRSSSARLRASWRRSHEPTRGLHLHPHALSGGVPSVHESKAGDRPGTPLHEAEAGRESAGIAAAGFRIARPRLRSKSISSYAIAKAGLGFRLERFENLPRDHACD